MQLYSIRRLCSRAEQHGIARYTSLAKSCFCSFCVHSLADKSKTERIAEQRAKHVWAVLCSLADAYKSDSRTYTGLYTVQDGKLAK